MGRATHVRVYLMDEVGESVQTLANLADEYLLMSEFDPNLEPHEVLPTKTSQYLKFCSRRNVANSPLPYVPYQANVLRIPAGCWTPLQGGFTFALQRGTPRAVAAFAEPYEWEDDVRGTLSLGKRWDGRWVVSIRTREEE